MRLYWVLSPVVRLAAAAAPDAAALDRELRFAHLPITDFGVPSDEAASRQAIDSLAEEWRVEHSMVAHCRVGIGRSEGIPMPETEGQRMWVRKRAAIHDEERR